jgi:hypothetical protein
VTKDLLTDLAKAKAIFQQRAILAAMGVNLSNSTPLEQCKYGDPYCPCQDGAMCHYEGPNPMKPRYRQCETCGDSDCKGGLPCESGGGV